MTKKQTIQKALNIAKKKKQFIGRINAYENNLDKIYITLEQLVKLLKVKKKV